jgi:hypothetical protein
MKKIIALVLVLTLSLFAFAACGGKDKGDNNDDKTPAEKNYSLAIGVATTQSAKDSAEISNTVAALIIDAENKIVACRIDTLSVKATLTDGIVDAGNYKTKAELGDSYGMLNSPWGGSTLAEWHNQAKAFETYVVGKTQAQVAGIALNSDGKPTDAALTAGCTIAVSDFVKAIDNAFKSDRKVAFKSSEALTLGVSANGTVANVKDKNNNPTAVASYTADYAATVIAGGKVIAAIIDSNEVTADITDNKIGTISNPGTKLEQGDKYGMVAYGQAVAEWYAQAQAYANITVGKTAAEVAGLSIDKIEGSCTMYVGGYKVALEKAASYTR